MSGGSHFSDDRWGVDWGPASILAIDSAAAGMFLAARFALEPGDEAIIFDPVDFLFAASVEAAGGKPVRCRIDPAATAALEEAGEWLEEFVRHLKEMRDYTVARLNELPGVTCRTPEGTYVAFANITGTRIGSEDVAQLLLDRARVAVVPGTARWFGAGAEGHIRLSFATSHGIMREALDRIAEALAACDDAAR